MLSKADTEKENSKEIGNEKNHQDTSDKRGKKSIEKKTLEDLLAKPQKNEKEIERKVYGRRQDASIKNDNHREDDYNDYKKYASSLIDPDTRPTTGVDIVQCFFSGYRFRFKECGSSITSKWNLYYYHSSSSSISTSTVSNGNSPSPAVASPSNPIILYVIDVSSESMVAPSWMELLYILNDDAEYNCYENTREMKRTNAANTFLNSTKFDEIGDNEVNTNINRCSNKTKIDTPTRNIILVLNKVDASHPNQVAAIKEVMMLDELMENHIKNRTLDVPSGKHTNTYNRKSKMERQAGTRTKIVGLLECSALNGYNCELLLHMILNTYLDT